MMILPQQNSDFRLSPSLLAADCLALGEAVQAVVSGGGHWLHLDLMDHHYVPQLSFGTGLCRRLKQASTLPLDVHLMVDHNDDYIEELIDAGVTLISCHPENSRHPQRTLTHIRTQGALAGLALAPATPIDVLTYLLDDIDFVLIMTVNPGYTGQRFIPAMRNKIKAVAEILHHYHMTTGRWIPIEVDGGIHTHNILDLFQQGARIFVLGAGIFQSNMTATEELYTLNQLLHNRQDSHGP